jgi:hypothetical protein
MHNTCRRLFIYHTLASYLDGAANGIVINNIPLTQLAAIP